MRRNVACRNALTKAQRIRNHHNLIGGMMRVDLIAKPYTIRLDMECEECCRGSLVRLPDGVEASFNCPDSLVVLLEGMGGRRWWHENGAQIVERFLPFLKLRLAS